MIRLAASDPLWRARLLPSRGPRGSAGASPSTTDSGRRGSTGASPTATDTFNQTVNEAAPRSCGVRLCRAGRKFTPAARFLPVYRPTTGLLLPVRKGPQSPFRRGGRTSMPTLTRRLTVLVALLAVGLPLGLAAARQQDPLSEAKQRQAVADQQSQKQADEAIELAKRGRSAEALKVIQDALDRVKNNPDLSDAKRDKLTRSLGYWRRQFDSEAKDPVTNPGTGTGKRPPPPTDPDRKGAYEQATKTLAVRGVNVIDASNLQD